jgi:hypothetical protein
MVVTRRLGGLEKFRGFGLTTPLKRFNGSLWKQVREFYESVRNPLFHGHQLQTDGFKYAETLDAVLRAYTMFVSVYKWIDWWCPQMFVMGNNVGRAMPISEMPTLPDGHPCMIRGRRDMRRSESQKGERPPTDLPAIAQTNDAVENSAGERRSGFDGEGSLLLR